MSKYRVQKVSASLALTHAGGATTKSSAAIAINGVLRHVKIVTPAVVDGSATTQIEVIDADGDAVYTKSGIAVNTRSITLLTQDLSVPLNGDYTIKVTYSAAQTVTDTVTTVQLLVDRA